ALDRFVRAFHIPFAESQAGKSALPSTHPLNLGGIGVTGNAAANRIAKEADLVIGVGTRFTDFTTASNTTVVLMEKAIAFCNDKTETWLDVAFANKTKPR